LVLGKRKGNFIVEVGSIVFLKSNTEQKHPFEQIFNM